MILTKTWLFRSFYEKAIIGALPRDCRVRLKLEILNKGEGNMNDTFVTIQFIMLHYADEY